MHENGVTQQLQASIVLEDVMYLRSPGLLLLQALLQLGHLLLQA